MLGTFLCAGMLAATSCGDDDEDEPVNNNPGGGGGGATTETVAVSGVEVSPHAVTLEAGKTISLTATVSPDNATDKTLSWTSSDDAVATVKDGTVTAVKEGEATITVKAGEKTAECKVTVTAPAVKTFTVSFDTDGGSTVTAQTVEEGKTANKPEDPAKTDFTFSGWLDASGAPYDFATAVTADITLKASWTANATPGPNPGGDSKYIAKAFSVSETKKVYFAAGNLQYHCKNKEWRFAPQQYDRIGVDNKNIADDYDGWIDLFGWGTGDNPTLSSTSTGDYSTFTDWGKKIGDGSTWATLSYEEWSYLKNERADASSKYGVAEVAGVQGLIFLPDEWTLPAGLTFNSGVANDYGSDYYKTKNEYTAADWEKMETAGAVFLPAAGGRYGTGVNEVGGYGDYWSSSPYVSDYAFSLYFYSDYADADGNYRGYGLSVRLARPL